MVSLYILYSSKFDKTYVGVTTNLATRIKSHNELATKGWTIKFRPWEIIHVEEFENKTDALAREKWFKSGVGREFIAKELLRK
jgi:putative endonuclease